MNTATFDTHQAVKAITNTGLKDTQAEAIVTTINNAMSQNLATKSDVVAVKADIATVRTELKADIATVTDRVEGRYRDSDSRVEGRYRDSDGRLAGLEMDGRADYNR